MESATQTGKAYDVLCMGLAVADVLLQPVGPGIFDVDTTRLDHIDLMPGGDAMNQAVALAGLGVKVALAAQVGDDPFGHILRRQAAERGVDVSPVLCNPHTVTSTSIVLIQQSGRRNFVYCAGNNDCFRYEDVPGELWGQAKLVSIGSLMGLRGFPGEKAAEAFRLAREAGAVTVADTTYDINGYGLSCIEPVLPYTDYFIPSLDEADSLLGPGTPQEQARAFLEMGAKHVVLKLGEKGCLAMDGRGHRFLPAYQVAVVDTTGCGDNFVAGVILGILRGENLERCGMLGNAMGALNAMQKGACAQRRTVEEVLAFMGAAQRKDV